MLLIEELSKVRYVQTMLYLKGSTAAELTLNID